MASRQTIRVRPSFFPAPAPTSGCQNCCSCCRPSQNRCDWELETFSSDRTWPNAPDHNLDIRLAPPSLSRNQSLPRPFHRRTTSAARSAACPHAKHPNVLCSIESDRQLREYFLVE